MDLTMLGVLFALRLTLTVTGEEGVLNPGLAHLCSGLTTGLVE